MTDIWDQNNEGSLLEIVENSIIDYLNEIALKRFLEYTPFAKKCIGVEINRLKKLGLESKGIRNFVFPEENVMVASQNDYILTDGFVKRNFNAVIYCMFFLNTKYDFLLRFRCDSKRLYDILATKNTENSNGRRRYSYAIYLTLSASLKEFVGKIRTGEPELLNTSLLTKTFATIYNNQKDVIYDGGDFYNALIKLLDYNHRYSVYSYIFYSWYFFDKEEEVSKVTGMERKDFTSYKTQIKDSSLTIGFEFDSFKKYVDYLGGNEDPGIYFGKLRECDVLDKIVFKDIIMKKNFAVKQHKKITFTHIPEFICMIVAMKNTKYYTHNRYETIYKTDISYNGVKTDGKSESSKKKNEKSTIAKGTEEKPKRKAKKKVTERKPLILTKEDIENTFKLPMDEIGIPYKIYGLVFLIGNDIFSAEISSGENTWIRVSSAGYESRDVDTSVMLERNKTNHVVLIFARYDIKNKESKLIIDADFEYESEEEATPEEAIPYRPEDVIPEEEFKDGSGDENEEEGINIEESGGEDDEEGDEEEGGEKGDEIQSEPSDDNDYNNAKDDADETTETTIEKNNELLDLIKSS